MDFSFHTVQIQTPRLTLRTLVPEDASQKYADWLNDPEVNRFLETKQGTLKSVHSYITAKQKQGDALLLGMFLRSDGSHIGTIKLEPINITTRTATIALMIGEGSARGKGYGPEAIRALVRYGFDDLGLENVDLDVVKENSAGIRAYEKVGFSKVARKPNTKPGHMAMAVTPRTFRSQEARSAPATV